MTPLYAQPSVQDQVHRTPPLDRAHLNRLLDVVTHGSVCRLVSATGWGKTTALDQWAAGRRQVWLTLDSHDNDSARLVRRLSEAADAAGTGPAGDTLVGELLGRVPVPPADRPVLVLDDAHEIAPDSDSARLLGELCLRAAGVARVVVAARRRPALWLEETGGPPVVELGAAALALLPAEVEALTEAVTGHPRLGSEVYRFGGGWPAVTRLLADGLRDARDPDLRQRQLTLLTQPGGAAFEYVADSLRREPAAVLELLRLLPRGGPGDPSGGDSAGLLRGLPDLLGRGLVRLDSQTGRWSPSALVAKVVRHHDPRRRGSTTARPAASEKRPRIAIQALGHFIVLRDGEQVPVASWRSRKARDLVKILVSRRGRPVAREQLMEYLWPEEPPDLSRRRLSVLLSTVRGVLRSDGCEPVPGPLVADRDVVRLDLRQVEVDVERFLTAVETSLRADAAGAPDALEQLSAAARLYEGDLLEENPYEEWAVSLRETARSGHLSLLRTIIRRSAAGTDPGSVHGHAMRLLECDRYDECAHLALVRTLTAAGQHGEALRRYQVYVARMAEIGAVFQPFPRR